MATEINMEGQGELPPPEQLLAVAAIATVALRAIQQYPEHAAGIAARALQVMADTGILIVPVDSPEAARDALDEILQNFSSASSDSAPPGGML